MNQLLKVRSPSDCLTLVAKYKNKRQEYFGAIFLDGNHQVIACKHFFIGGINRCFIDPRVIYRYALIKGAVAIIAFHNHPSGCCDPSSEDLMTTAQLKKGSEYLGIKLLDHVIIAKYAYYSFLEHDMMNEISNADLNAAEGGKK